MQFLTLLSVAFAFATRSVLAADNAEVAAQIAETLTNFQGAGLIPVPISQDWAKFTAGLEISYGDDKVDIGEKKEVKDIQSLPKYTLNFPTGQNASGYYTAMFVDADVAGNTNPTVTRHMLANNLTVVNGELKNFTQYITDYAPPLPAEGSGPHRYLQLVFSQPADFTAPANLSAAGQPVENNWDFVSYVNSLQLTLIAGSYIQVEVGETASSVSVSSTASVPSASLQAVSSSVAAAFATGTNGPSGSGSGSGSGKDNSASALSAAGGLALVGSLIALFA